jgi:Protein of unknown function (DUF2752)
MNKQLKAILKGVGLAIWLALPFVFWWLPADQFDCGQSICPSQLLLHKDCPGCGLIRATQHFMHLHISKAWGFNKLIVITFPVTAMLYLHVLGKLINKRIFSFLEKFY